MELVTGRTGEAHITSQQDRQKHQGVFGQDAVILETGNMLTPELQNSNEIHIKDGALMYQGALFSVKVGTYDRITINNGNQGKKRKDLIVARYTYNPKEDIELGEWGVIQGEPTEGTPIIPEVTTGDIQKGDTVVECPVFVVTLDGINVTGIDIIPKRMKSITEIEKELDSLNGNKIDSYKFGPSFPAVKTGEYLNGDPVYIKMVDAGALPNNTTKNVATGISDANYIWIDPSNSIVFSGGASYPIPYVDPANIKNAITCRLTGGGATLAIQTGTNWSGYAALVVVKFTRK